MKILQKIVFLQKSSGKFKKKRFDIEKYTFFFDKIGVTRLGLGTAKKYYEREKMKKLLSVSIMAMLAVSPMMANAAPVETPAGGVASSTGLTATAGPFYSLQDISDNDKKGVASAAYVKGAYNNAIRAINKVAETANAGQTAEEVATAVQSGINAAGGAGLTAANGSISVGAGDGITVNADTIEVNEGDGLAINATSKAVEVKAADTTIDVSSNGVKVGTITTANLTGSLAEGVAAGAVNNKLATQGYVQETAASAASTALTDYKVKDVAANGDIAVDANGKIDLSSGMKTAISGKANSADLATVATTGSFSDLTNVPTTVSGYGITDAYTKTEVDSAINTATTDMATGTGVEYTIEHTTYTTALTVPLYTEWGTTTTANTDTVTATTTAAATYATGS